MIAPDASTAAAAPSHVQVLMATEAIARYGCPSTAVIFMMHLVAVGGLVFRAHGNPEIQALLRRMDAEALIGTASYTDPETGGHFWYPKTSGAERVDDGWHVRKTAAFTTSSGYASWYLTQTTSPDFSGDYSDLSVFLLYPDEVQAQPGRLGRDGHAREPVGAGRDRRRDPVRPHRRPGRRRRAVERRGDRPARVPAVRRRLQRRRDGVPRRRAPARAAPRPHAVRPPHRRLRDGAGRLRARRLRGAGVADVRLRDGEGDGRRHRRRQLGHVRGRSRRRAADRVHRVGPRGEGARGRASRAASRTRCSSSAAAAATCARTRSSGWCATPRPAG